MCIPHGVATKKSNGYVKQEKKPTKHISKPSESMMKKGDPDFVDERTHPYEAKKSEGFLSKFFK